MKKYTPILPTESFTEADLYTAASKALEIPSLWLQDAIHNSIYCGTSSTAFKQTDI